MLCGSLIFIFSFSYGSRSLPVRRYDYFQCTDNDQKLSQCAYDGPFPNGCRTSSRGAVSCKKTNKCKLQIYNRYTGIGNLLCYNRPASYLSDKPKFNTDKYNIMEV